jgi:hypothetical protein
MPIKKNHLYTGGRLETSPCRNTFLYGAGFGCRRMLYCAQEFQEHAIDGFGCFFRRIVPDAIQQHLLSEVWQVAFSQLDAKSKSPPNITARVLSV